MISQIKQRLTLREINKHLLSISFYLECSERYRHMNYFIIKMVRRWDPSSSFCTVHRQYLILHSAVPPQDTSQMKGEVIQAKQLAHFARTLNIETEWEKDTQEFREQSRHHQQPGQFAGTQLPPPESSITSRQIQKLPTYTAL